MRTDTVAFTDELPFPWSQPPITATYATFHARVRAGGRRFKRSQFARDLSTAYAATFWWRCLVAALFVAGFLFATRHTFLDWSGAHSILTGGH